MQSTLIFWKYVQHSRASKVSIWKAFLEPGVKHALFVGLEFKILQEFSGINGVIYYPPEILEEAVAEVLIADIGISLDSASLFSLWRDYSRRLHHGYESYKATWK